MLPRMMRKITAGKPRIPQRSMTGHTTRALQIDARAMPTKTRTRQIETRGSIAVGLVLLESDIQKAKVATAR